MRNDPYSLMGEKIRRIRREKGLTQKQLAGDKVTRNMISLIESGREFPSASTIVHIAEKLEIPAGYLFATSPDEEGMYEKELIISGLRKAFEKDDHDTCLKLLAGFPDDGMDDELLYIYAVSLLRNALMLADRLNLAEALKKLALADETGSRSVYCGTGFRKAVSYYSELIRTVCSDDITDAMTDISVCGSEVPSETVSYFINLKLVRSGEKPSRFCESRGFQLSHINAVDQMLEEEYPDALRTLRNLADNERLPFYMKYRVLCDLETAASAARDMSDAYYASKRRLDMIEELSPQIPG